MITPLIQLAAVLVEVNLCRSVRLQNIIHRLIKVHNYRQSRVNLAQEKEIVELFLTTRYYLTQSLTLCHKIARAHPCVWEEPEHFPSMSEMFSEMSDQLRNLETIYLN